MNPDIIEFVTDPQLLDLSVSPAQEALLRGIYALPMSEEQAKIFRDCTGRTMLPSQPFSEVTVIAGARSGKDSRIATPIAVYEAVFGQHERFLAKGEFGVIPVVAANEKQTRVAFSYIKGYLTESPLLAAQIEEVRASEIYFRNRIMVSCFPCTVKGLRSWSIPAGIMSEVAFYRLEGAADSDAEIQASIRRGTVAFPETKLVKVTTAYLRSGIAYDDFTRGWSRDDPDLLVWKAATTLMNPTISAERIEREQRLDPRRAEREYGATFVDDVASFLSQAWLDGAVETGRHELPPRPGVSYTAAVDTSGGGSDSFTCAIVHTEGSGAAAQIVLDVMRGRGDLGANLEAVVAEYCGLLKQYGCSRVVSDRYASGWVRERFRDHGITCEDPQVDGKPVDTSETFLQAEPLFAQGRVSLLDHPTLLRELRNLEKHPRPAGRTMVAAPRSLHDDFAAALCRAIVATRVPEAKRYMIYAALGDHGPEAIVIDTVTGTIVPPDPAHLSPLQRSLRASEEALYAKTEDDKGDGS